MDIEENKEIILTPPKKVSTPKVTPKKPESTSNRSSRNNSYSYQQKYEVITEIQNYIDLKKKRTNL